jgi:hypothetical protein
MARQHLSSRCDRPGICRQHPNCPTTVALYRHITDGAAPGPDLEFWIGVFEMTRDGLLRKGWAGHVNEIERAFRRAHASPARLAQQRQALLRAAPRFSAQTKCRRGHALHDAVVRGDGRRECRQCKNSRDKARRNRRASGVQPRLQPSEGGHAAIAILAGAGGAR